MTAPAVLVLTLTADDLRSIVREAVRAEIGTSSPASATATTRVTLDELARLEACSRATIRRLVAEGAPVTYVGQSPRFDVEAFRAWLEARGRKGTQAPAKMPGAPVAGVRLLSRGKR